MTVGVTEVRFVRGGRKIVVHPVDNVNAGIFLAKDQVEGIYDAPVKTTWKTGAFQDGSRQKAIKRTHRDMMLGFHVTETISDLYEFNESEFRRMFTYELDQWENVPTVTTLEVETVLSGVRKLDVLMYEQPEFKAPLDPLLQQYGNLIMKLRAGQPMWYEDDDVSVFESSAASDTDTVTIWNPTDQIMYHEWVLTPATWTIPDPEWVGGPNEREPGGPFEGRTLDVLVTADDEGARISLDRQKVMIRNLSDSVSILARLGGKAFSFPVPPYTPPTQLTVAYSAAPPGGARCELHQPRRWSRPWGLEWVYGS